MTSRQNTSSCPTNEDGSDEFSISPEVDAFLRNANTNLAPMGMGNDLYDPSEIIFIARFPGVCWNCECLILVGQTIQLCRKINGGAKGYRHFHCPFALMPLEEAKEHMRQIVLQRQDPVKEENYADVVVSSERTVVVDSTISQDNEEVSLCICLSQFRLYNYSL